MKKFIAMALGMVAFGTVLEAHAEPPAEEVCKNLYDHAEVIMEARQEGVPMPDMMEVSSGQTVLETLVKQAYSRPQYNVPENRWDATRRFANNKYSECLEIMDN